MEKSYSSFFNGENRSKSDQTGFYSMTNGSPHTELGLYQNNLALASASTTPSEPFISEVLSNGDIIMASTTTGKIWKRTAAGVFSLVHTNTNGANKGIKLWLGYVYYATTAKLGRIAEANASSEATWSTQNDTYASFTIGGTYKPMVIIGSGLYIGDGYYVAVVDSTHTFIADALDIPSMFTITVVADINRNLLVGTIIGNNVGWCMAYLWNRISPSWNNEYRVNDVGINCFIQGDNINLLSVGTTGQISYLGSENILKFKKIKGSTTGVNPYNSTIYKGRPLFAIGTKIYSINREDGDFPYAVVCEYTAPGTIYSIISTVSNIYVSYGTGCATIGASYATAEIETPQAEGDFKGIEVPYESIGTGGSIGISTSVDGGAYAAKTPIIDTVNKKVKFNGGLGKVNSLMAKVTLTGGLVKIKGIKFI